MTETTIPTLTCTRCGHTWVRRQQELPKQCPRCRNGWWNEPRRNKRKAKQEATR